MYGQQNIKLETYCYFYFSVHIFITVRTR